MDAGASKILIAVDFSPCSHRALDAGVRLAKDLGAAVVLVHALADRPRAPVYEGAEARRMFEEAAAEADAEDMNTLAAEFAEDAQAAGLTVETVAAHGHAAQVILDTAQERGATMIVVGSHGRTGLERLVLGSVAQDVASRADVPVLVVPQAD